MSLYRPAGIVIHRLVAVLLATAPASVSAWSEDGHSLIARMAFGLLQPHEQHELLALVGQHPQYAEEFAPPIDADDPKGYQIGRLGGWLDRSIESRRYGRPEWRGQKGATVEIGTTRLSDWERSSDVAGSLTIEDREAQCLQAINVCRFAMDDLDRRPAERAMAAAYLAGLVGNACQPCNAGSLYAEHVFPEGDSWGAGIPLVRGGSLRDFWDQLLDDWESERSLNDILLDLDTSEQAAGYYGGTLRSLPKSVAREAVYTAELVDAVREASASKANQIEPIALSDDYVNRAKAESKQLAYCAALALSRAWSRGLTAYHEARLKAARTEPYTVWVNPFATAYHRSECREVDENAVGLPLEAIDKRLPACEKCQPFKLGDVVWVATGDGFFHCQDCDAARGPTAPIERRYLTDTLRPCPECQPVTP